MPASDMSDGITLDTNRLATVLREAGDIALRTFRGPIRSWTKGHDSPVSEADMAVDALLRERLAMPGVGWLSEESEDDRARLSTSRVVVADPIDGTRAYLAGRADWSICVALVEAGRPVLAGIFAPVDNEMLVAAAGQGARCNDRPLAASAGDTLQGASVAGPQRYLDRLATLAPGIAKSPKIHSLALRLARVAQGQLDVAMASVNAHDWDLAAADLLVHEAGGTMTDTAGRPLVYNLHNTQHGALIAAGRNRHRAVLDLVQERWKLFA